MEKLLEYKGITYIVSSEGKVYSTSNRGRGGYHKELKQRFDVNGYLAITAGSNKQRTVVRVHKLVALAFIPNPDPKNLVEVDHIDNNRINNSANNLQWISSYDNKAKIPFERRSNCRKGERNGRATITEEQVKEIRMLYKGGKRIIDISKDFNIPHSTVGNIVHYKTWKCVHD